ncbi:hypothetical protein [uncultured Dechloromonas sp.]|uniref:hypothetical protein n=1 Tax=uncultured Dechloromonas sp. TaxID=171719 RepID=UPI0025FFF3A5|nr:hypothetical protein [uncultured Dechloromonas sp.]
MSLSTDLIDAFKEAQGGISDYRVAQLLEVKTPTMTKYRKEMLPLSPEKVLFLCELAGFDSVDWLLALYRERAKCDKERSIIDALRNRTAA